MIAGKEGGKDGRKEGMDGCCDGRRERRPRPWGVKRSSWPKAALWGRDWAAVPGEKCVFLGMCVNVLSENHDLLPFCSSVSKNNSASSLDDRLV